MNTTLLERRPGHAPDHLRFDDITRREFVIGAAAAIALVTITSCAEDDERAAGGATRTFVDSTGTAVEVPDRAERIVATNDQGAGAPLLGLGAPLVGIASRDGVLDPSIAAYFDVEGIELVGEHFEPDVEAIAALEPDLIVHEAFDGQISLEPTTLARLQEIAPVVGLDPFRPIDEVTADVAELLGGDAGALLDEQQAELDELTEELRGLIDAAGGGVSGSFVITLGDVLEAWGPSTLGATNLLSKAGVSWVPLMVEADLPENAGWIGDLSMERLPEFSADLVLVETSYDSPILSNPVFKTFPAVAAGQVVEFNSAELTDLHYPGVIAIARYLIEQISAMNLRGDIV